MTGTTTTPAITCAISQVCCANFLFPFFDRPTALAGLLRPIFPVLYEMLPIEDGQFVAHEWIGAHNYLHEKISPGKKRTRGALFTSADAAVKFRRTDGKIQVVLIEWKYTEAYYPTSVKFAASGTDKSKIYEHLYLAEDCPIDKAVLPHYDDLFYEPFYQLMRQQFLAHEMEKAHELGADVVSLLHIAPAHNTDFQRVTSPGLQHIATSATKVWHRAAKVTAALFERLQRGPVRQVPGGSVPGDDGLVAVHYSTVSVGGGKTIERARRRAVYLTRVDNHPLPLPSPYGCCAV